MGFTDITYYYFDQQTKTDDQLQRQLYKHCQRKGLWGQDFIIIMRSKYKNEKTWDYHMEYLEVDFDSDYKFVWLDDWYEGQQDIEFIAFINTYDLEQQLIDAIK